MAHVALYATVPGDPTTGAVVCWIDSDPAGPQSLWYGEGTATIEVTPSVSAGGLDDTTYAGHRVYSAVLSGLAPDTAYVVEVREGATVLAADEIRTFPAQIVDSSLRVGWVSDLHLSGALAPSQLTALAAWEPDLLLFGGDLVQDGASRVPDKSVHWLTFFASLYAPISAAKGRLVPIVVTPGNHDVGNSTWNGTGSVDPTAGYLHLFFPTPRDLEPAGQNYAAVQFGDYLQLIVLDSHSATPASQTAWLESVINPHSLLCLPIHHSPMLPGGSRAGGGDPGLQEQCRNAWAKALHDAGNVRVHFCGHIHLRKRSVPWGISTTDPGGDRFVLPGGYMHAQAGGIIEIGDGWYYNRNPWPTTPWYIDSAASASSGQFFGLVLEPDNLRVTTYAHSGATIWSQDWPLTGYPPPAIEYQWQILPAGSAEWETLLDWIAGDVSGDRLVAAVDWSAYPPGETQVRYRARDANEPADVSDWSDPVTVGVIPSGVSELVLRAGQATGARAALATESHLVLRAGQALGVRVRPEAEDGERVWPVADVSNAGWTDPAHPHISDGVDGTFADSSIGHDTDVLVVRLGEMQAVTTGSGDTAVRFRAGKVAAGGAYGTTGDIVELEVELLTPAGAPMDPPVAEVFPLGLLATHTLQIPAGLALTGQHQVRVTKTSREA